MPPHEQDARLEWWEERFAVEGFGWYGGMQKEHHDDHWPTLAAQPVESGGSLEELAALGVQVKRVGPSD